MRSLPFEGYQGRYLSVSAEDITTQRAAGWPDFHPEDFCHRCGHKNVSWYIDGSTWADVMRSGDPLSWGRWQEIICIPCFIELAEERAGGCAWRITRDEHGSESLALLHVGGAS